MTKMFREFLKDSVIVFDIDGVLASYEFGEECHTADIWEEAFKTTEDNPYCTVEPISALQDFIAKMPKEHAFVCSVASAYEADAKKAFVLRHYQIEPSHIYLVDSKDKKLELLEELSLQFPGKTVAIVDDTVKTLDMIHEKSDFATVHITSFFD